MTTGDGGATVQQVHVFLVQLFFYRKIVPHRLHLYIIIIIPTAAIRSNFNPFPSTKALRTP